MKILFQGALGAYSHLAALEVYPDAEIIPCKTFDECFSKAVQDEKLKIIIPESNKTTGNIGIEYLIFQYRLNIYAEHFHRIEHNLLGVPGAKIKDINLFSDDFNSTAELMIKSMKHKLKIIEIPGENIGRKYGSSKMKILKNIYNTLKTIYLIKKDELKNKI